jgi:hypothetical protein
MTPALAPSSGVGSFPTDPTEFVPINEGGWVSFMGRSSMGGRLTAGNAGRVINPEWPRLIPEVAP